MTKPRDEVQQQVGRLEQVGQVPAGGRAKHLLAVGAVPNPVSRTGADQAAHTSSSVVDRIEKGGAKLLLLSKQHGTSDAADSNWNDDGSSPPRFTHDPDYPDNNNINNSNGDVNPSLKSSGTHLGGGASLMSDHELVELLRRPPKSTLVLRTKSNFQQFFRGVDRCRMQSLLARAYEDIADASERSLKIKKRLGLLDDGDA